MASIRVYIFNVYHGFCALVKAPNGYGYLIDCGRWDNFSPARYIKDNIGLTSPDGVHPLAQLLVTHPHDDHIEDISNVKSFLAPKTLLRDATYDWDDIKQEGGDEGYENLDTYVTFQQQYNQPAVPTDWAGVTFSSPAHLSPEDAMGLTGSVVNNSSLPLFVEYAGARFLFTGDLETAGWQELLKKKAFKDELDKGVHFFIASHHGHDSGYCSEVFDAMGDPLVNIISARHDDASVSSQYSARAKGVILNGQTRKSLTTRKDGTILIEVTSDSKYEVYTEHLANNE
jgi:competence protein ComEC